MSSKKNNDINFSFIVRWIFNNFFALAAALVAIVNLWLVNKLSPMAQDIKILQTRVSAIEKQQDRYEQWMERIEGKIDRLILDMKERG